MGLQILGVASLAAAVNFFVTIVNLRAKGMTMMRMPMFVWMSFITQILLLLAFPVITVALILLMFDRFFGTHFFVPAGGGDPMLWQHLFWIFGHPEVYILILPGVRDHLRGAAGLLAEAALRLRRDGVLRGVHRLPRLRRVEPPHVLDRHGPDRGHVLLPRHDADRHPHRGEDLQLDRHDLGRLAPAQDADATSRSASSRCSSWAGCPA